MTKTFTTTLNSETNNKTEVDKETNAENLENDEIIFFDSLRADLDLIQMTPKSSTIENILTYSNNLR